MVEDEGVSTKHPDEGSKLRSKRLDLIDLLQRYKLQEKEDKRFNLIIIVGALSVVAVASLFLLLL